MKRNFLLLFFILFLMFPLLASNIASEKSINNQEFFKLKEYYFPIVIGMGLAQFYISNLSVLEKNIDEGRDNQWHDLPGFTPDSSLTLTSYESFGMLMSMALLSFYFSEYVFSDSTNNKYYLTMRMGKNDGIEEKDDQYKNVSLFNFGFEVRFSHWFAFTLENNIQNWEDSTPLIEDINKSGMGIGLMTYYRWYLFGKSKLSLYLEYGTGLFYGFEKFPSDGTNFTFNHSSQVGIEYTFKNGDKLRFGYGQFHQSNGNVVTPNPGYDANGFSLSFAYLLKD